MGLVDRERIKLATLQLKIAPALEAVDREFQRITTGDSPLTRDICDHIRQGKSKRFRPTLLLLAAQDKDGFAPEAIANAIASGMATTPTTTPATMLPIRLLPSDVYEPLRSAEVRFPATLVFCKLTDPGAAR